MIYDESKKMSLAEIKSVELDLLIEFDSFCNEHNLKYALDGGTLIGALRHKGFIPWDDDIDVTMPFPDFLKFVELYKKKEKILMQNFCMERIIHMDFILENLWIKEQL